MRSFILLSALVSISLIGLCQTYTFIGNGNWSVSSNWSNNTIPPSVLPTGDSIVISSAPDDSCVLNITSQIILPGAHFIVSTGSNLILHGSLGIPYPVVTITGATANGCSATIVANVTSNSGSQVTERGLVWSTDHNPDINSNPKITLGSGTGSYYGFITGLDLLKSYYVRAFATNSSGTGYSNERIVFTTKPTFYLNTNSVTLITSKSAVCGGLLDGAICISSIASAGVVWDIKPNPNIQLPTKTSDSLIVGSTTTYTSNINGLSPNTTYYLRTYILTILGDTLYGESRSFTTLTGHTAMLSTTIASGITNVSAVCGGVITSDGGGSIISRGVVWSTNPLPNAALSTKTSDGIGTGNFTSNISGLMQNTKYYIRAYAINDGGTHYGNQDSFVTLKAPILTTTSICTITNTAAVSGGYITSDGDNPVTERGIVWSINHNPTTTLITKIINGTGVGLFTANMTDLLPNTTYYVRAYAINSVATVYGNEIGFTTVNPNIASVVICGKEWANKNLDVITYRNGDTIPQVTDPNVWAHLTTGAWCYYANNTTNGNMYGKLYNWFAVKDPRGLAPQGWHIPSVSEWSTMSCLGSDVGIAMAIQDPGWASAASNSTGFTALPGGCRNPSGYGNFVNIGFGGFWWTTDEYGTSLPGYAWGKSMWDSTEPISPKVSLETAGLSVRCVRD